MVKSNKDINVLHICDANCRNWGEKLVMECTQNLLHKYIFNDIKNLTIVAENTCDNDVIDYPYISFKMDGIENIINSYDVIVIGGGTFNFLRYRFVDKLDVINKPFIVLSSGWNRMGFSESGRYNSEKLFKNDIDNVNKVINKSSFFSVRIDGTDSTVNILI